MLRKRHILTGMYIFSPILCSLKQTKTAHTCISKKKNVISPYNQYNNFDILINLYFSQFVGEKILYIDKI